MTRLAYSTAPANVCETLAKKYFIDALKSADMRLKTQQSRPQNFNDAIRHAVWSDAFVGEKRKQEAHVPHRSPAKQFFYHSISNILYLNIELQKYCKILIYSQILQFINTYTLKKKKSTF